MVLEDRHLHAELRGNYYYIVSSFPGRGDPFI